MHWRCDICDKVIYEGFRDNHLESGFHGHLANSIIRKFIISNPKPNTIDDIIRKYIRSHHKKHEQFQVIILLRLILPSNQIKYIRRRQRCLGNELCVMNSSFFPEMKIMKEQLYFHISELGITVVSLFKIIGFEHYLTKPKSMLEWKLVAMFDRNPKIVHSFDYTRYNHPLFQDFFDI